MRFVAAAGAVGTGLVVLAGATAIGQSVANAGHDGAAALAAALAALLVGGAVAGAFVRPRVRHGVALAALLVVILWIRWEPSGEAGPSERSMDLRAAAGTVFGGIAAACVWSAVVAAGHSIWTHRQPTDIAGPRG